jgi:hypothetical protein
VLSISYINSKSTIRKLYGIAGAILVLAIPYIMTLFSSAEEIEIAQSLCPFKMVTGLPCPGCGITKSFVFIYEGNLFKSFHYHLFGPFAFIFSIIVIIVLSIEVITKKEYFNGLLYSTKIAYFSGATLAIYHFVRLIHFISTNSLNDILIQSIWK